MEEGEGRRQDEQSPDVGVDMVCASKIGEQGCKSGRWRK